MKRFLPTTKTLVVIIGLVAGTAYTHFMGISQFPDVFHLGLTGWLNALLITVELFVIAAVTAVGIIFGIKLLVAYDKWRKN